LTLKFVSSEESESVNTLAMNMNEVLVFGVAWILGWTCRKHARRGYHDSITLIDRRARPWFKVQGHDYSLSV